ncbi:hypothetical protein [Mesomycoplasma molare]|uniref:Preprotein translocase subunit SecE n=1 Tax=Mesomycoplasma molare TaxID=171288 RepID=A0ABY5TU36_9BACT|nr:hypothetical protein [Mesomycoplasma molare]UWD34177.1 hypothetical protein NX772_03785 [Mesomycoplasma molare]
MKTIKKNKIKKNLESIIKWSLIGFTILLGLIFTALSFWGLTKLLIEIASGNLN